MRSRTRVTGLTSFVAAILLFLSMGGVAVPAGLRSVGVFRGSAKVVVTSELCIFVDAFDSCYK